MNLEPVAATYAQALLQAADEKGLLDDVLEEVIFFEERLRTDRELRFFVENPRLEKAAKQASLESALRGRVSDTFLHFLLVVISKGRQLSLPGMLDAYKALYDDKVGIVRAEAVSAVPMSEEALGILESRMSEALGKKILVTAKVDPKILGGVVVRFSGMVADGSLRTELESVRASMSALKFGSELVHED